MQSIIHQYKLRLTNLSQSNRSLKLGKLSSRKDLDMMEASYVGGQSTEEILTRVMSGRSVELIRSLSAQSEATARLDLHLNRLYREVETLYEETGAYDLFLGYPFVEGKFLDGSIARCPVFLFPVRLERDFTNKPRWKLSVQREDDISLNKTFFLAYEKFQQTRLPKEFWEEEWPRQSDLQEFLNHAYAIFRKYELELNFNSELFRFQVMSFPTKNKDLLDQLTVGHLKLYPHAVMGIFPQSDSALVQDYEAMEADPDAFDTGNLLQTQGFQVADTYVPEHERLFVAPVDQSQEEGLLMVKRGASVVVHGPPGTGKSQVILNLIADAMARGQKVLVCSQKRAALDVVYQRLNETGLGKFAALVHDFRADRSKIFQRIREQVDSIEEIKADRLDLNLDKAVRDFRQASRKLDEHNQFFDALHQALTGPAPCGLRPQELYLLAEYRPLLDGIAEAAAVIDHGEWLDFRDKLRGLYDYREFFRAEHPWYYRLSFARWGFSDRAQIADKLTAVPAQLQQLARSWEEAGLTAFLGGQAIKSRQELGDALKAYDATMELLASPQVKQDIAHFECDSMNMTQVRKHLDRLRGLFQKMAKFTILDDFPMNLHADLRERFDAYEAKKGRFGRFFSLSWLSGRWYVRQVLHKNERRLKEKDVDRLRKELQTLNQLMDLVLKLDEQHFFKDLPLMEGPQRLLQWVEEKHASLDAVKVYRGIQPWKALLPQPAGHRFPPKEWDRIVHKATAMKGIQAQLEAFRLGWGSWLAPAQMEVLTGAFAGPDPALAFAEKLKTSFQRDFEDLHGLDLLIGRLTSDEKRALSHLESAMHRYDAPEDFLREVENSFYLAWIEQAEMRNPVLAEVSSRQMPHRRQQFMELVSEREAKVTDMILHRLRKGIVESMEYNRLGNPVTYRELAHQVRKQRMLWSVRKLVQTFWEEELPRLVPCWLASPESVAAIFPMEKDYFDLVIFDEASQCYVERALPVMLRGRQCVIAGDDKQLPPFDLYNVKVDESEDAFFEDEMALEVESVLDLSRNVFADCKLSWHYRSREEELINFSNHAFYEGRLKVIPPAQNEAHTPPPIHWIQVPGIWEQNRNRVEAERVVQLVEELVSEPNPPTIGIVTFNFHQKELIRDLLEQRLQELSDGDNGLLLSALYQAMERGEGEERQGIFVKNIENVQGDERDVIIFSIGYAPDRTGRLIANFGLLNRKGGENRLNVAITRSKLREYVVCSFDPEVLDVADSKHPGPRIFKQYLKYARAVSQGQREAAHSLLVQVGKAVDAAGTGLQARLPGDSMARQLAGRLRAKGLQVAEGVGDTGFRMDLAVLDAEGSYVLGIECEGENYFSGKSAKEREVYRPGMLLQRGWKLHRVWSRNFFLHPDEVVQDILDRVQEASGGEATREQEGE